MAESYFSSNPPETKVNTDGSVAIEAAAAAIARDFIGHPLWAFRKTVEWREIWKVELYAIRHTVEMASRMGIQNLWVESDSLYAVKMINSQCKPHKREICCWASLKMREPYSLLESPIVGGRAIEPPTLLRDVELCLNVPKRPPLALNDIIREEMQGLIYVRVWYIMYHFNNIIIYNEKILLLLYIIIIIIAARPKQGVKKRKPFF